MKHCSAGFEKKGNFSSFFESFNRSSTYYANFIG